MSTALPFGQPTFISETKKKENTQYKVDAALRFQTVAMPEHS